MVDAACNARRHGRNGGPESQETATRSGIMNAVIVAVPFQAGLRRS